MSMANHVMYLHGLEGSPNGTKGRWMRRFMNAVAPELPASRTDLRASFDASYAVAKQAIIEHAPDVIVGSSFGGGILMRLLQDGVWAGNCVMLAPAGVMYGVGDSVPEGSHVIIIHAPSDKIVAYSDSEVVVKNSPGRALLWDAASRDNEDGNHRLHDIVVSGLLSRAVVEQLTRSIN